MFNAFKLRRVNRQLAGLTWQRGMLSNMPDQCVGLDTQITALMKERCRLENTALVCIPLDFICHGCGKRHRENVTPARLVGAYSDWHAKHRQESCRIETFIGKRSIPGSRGGFSDRLYSALGIAPWWLNYSPNADIKTAYGASADLTITLASLGNSSTYVAGQESTAISNTSNLYLDVGIRVRFTTHSTAPTPNTAVQAWGYASIADTPAYPSNHTGSNSAVTHTAETRDGGLNLFGVQIVSNATSKTYTMKIKGMAAIYDYIMPQEWGIWITNGTGQILHATGSNHSITYLPIYATG